MNKNLITILLAGSFLALPLAVQAKGGPGGQGKGWRFQNQNQVQDRQRLRDGSCQNQTPSQVGSRNRKGNTKGQGMAGIITTRVLRKGNVISKINGGLPFENKV